MAIVKTLLKVNTMEANNLYDLGSIRDIEVTPDGGLILATDAPTEN